MRKLTLFSFTLLICISTYVQAQVNEFDTEVKLNSVQENVTASSILIHNEDGTIGIRPIESFNIPSLKLTDQQLEIELNGEKFVIDLSDNSAVNPGELINSFQLNGTHLELGVFGNSEKFVVDLAPIIVDQYKAAAIGEWSTVSNVTSNAPGDIANDDLVFGSDQLGNAAGTDDDSRMFFDKSKSAFRAGVVTGNQWSDANVGEGSVAFGSENIADGSYSAVVGSGNNVTGNSSFAAGQDNTMSAKNSAVFGQDNVMSGNKSLVFGAQNTVSAQNAVAAGFSSEASANYAVAIGNNNEASGEASVALGTKTEATMEGATAVGKQTNATGLYSYAGGHQTTASNESATAFGTLTTAAGKASFTAGEKTRSESYGQTTMGSFNTNSAGDPVNFVATDRLFVLGNGTDNLNKSDALTVLKNGNTTLNGNLTIDADNAGVNPSYTLPGQDGNANQYMMTDGAGNASWSDLPANNDNDATNEYNTSVSLSGTTLTVTDGGGGKTADLASLQDGTGTDDQTLTEVLTQGASAGNNKITNLMDPAMDQDAATKKYVDDNDAVNDADSNPLNELNTTMTLTGTTLSVTDAGGNVSADLASLQDGTGTDDQTLTEVLTQGASAGNNKITNLMDPAMDQDAATKKYVDDSAQTISASGGASPVITLSASGGSINLIAGTNVTLSQSGNNITINSSGGGGGSGVSAYGSGSAGNVTISANEDWTNTTADRQFADLTIDPGVTLTVPSGTIIRCTGTFTNNGTLVVGPGAIGETWAGGPLFPDYPDEKANSIKPPFTGDSGISRAFPLSQLKNILHPGPFGGGNGARGNGSPNNNGGDGGGSLVLRAMGGIVNNGIINANGGDAAVLLATDDDAGGGGGAGGFLIFAAAANITNAGTINLNGGDGADAGPLDDDHGGGGGSGGVIHFLSPNAGAVGGTVNVNGGAGGNAGAAPQLGSGGGGGGAMGSNGGAGGDDSGGVVIPSGAGGAGLIITTVTPDPGPLFF